MGSPSWLPAGSWGSPSRRAMPGGGGRCRSVRGTTPPLVNAALDIHHDDPAFGYRFIADELPTHGVTAGANRVARLCSSPADLVGVRQAMRPDPPGGTTGARGPGPEGIYRRR